VFFAARNKFCCKKQTCPTCWLGGFSPKSKILGGGIISNSLCVISMQEDKQDKKKYKGGRKPKKNPSKFRYSVNMNEEENARFLAMVRNSEMNNISRFILSVLFGKEIKVVKIDKSTKDYYMRLTTFYNQYQAIGVNYNQTVKALKTNFGEKRAVALLHKLEKATIEIVVLSKLIIQLTKEYEKKYLMRNINGSKNQ